MIIKSTNKSHSSFQSDGSYLQSTISLRKLNFPHLQIHVKDTLFDLQVHHASSRVITVQAVT